MRQYTFGLYTILPPPIVYSIYSNTGGSGVTLHCAMVWATGRGGGALTKGVCAENSIDSCTKAQAQNHILYRVSIHSHTTEVRRTGMPKCMVYTGM